MTRNNTLATMTFAKDGMERMNQLGRFLVNISTLDWELRNSINYLATLADEIGVKLGVASGSFPELWNDLSKKYNEAKAKADVIEERLKEHAISSEIVRSQVWDMTSGKCFYCEVQLVRGPDCEGDRSNVFHVDHLVPKSAGGPDHLTNYVPSCQTCNISKSDKPVGIFMSARKPKLALVASS